MAFVILISFVILLSVLLIVIILPQQSAKGGGLTSMVGGANQVIGVRNTTDLLEKITWGLISAIFVLALISNFLL